jgi:hypothetical protein
MKAAKILMTLACLVTAGCATNQGGSYEEPETGYGEGVSPEPAGSPTFRPGMNPQDIRDPNALTRPEPPSSRTPTSPPSTPPRMSPGSTP